MVIFSFKKQKRKKIFEINIIEKVWPQLKFISISYFNMHQSTKNQTISHLSFLKLEHLVSLK